MFRTTPPPQLELREAWRGLLDQITLSESFRSRAAPFVALALTHPGALNALRNRPDTAPWQHKWLEYVGFRYLELLIAHLLIDSRPDSTAAELNDAARRKITILDAGEVELHLAQVAHVPAALAASGANFVPGLHAALIGALALVAEYPQLKRFFEKHYMRKNIPIQAGLSFKTTLQEFSQTRHLIPAYELVREFGSDHSKNFQVVVKVGSKSSKVADGLSKRKAEEAAAGEWLRANAHGYLQSKILQQAAIQHNQRPKKALILAEETDGRSLRALRHFNLDQAQAGRLTRAMMHSSYRAAKHLPEFADNRAFAHFGSLVLQTGLGHFAASRFFGSVSPTNQTSLALLSGSSLSTEALEPITAKLGLLSHVRMGPQMRIAELSASQKVSFLQALAGVRFLAQAPFFDIETALGPEILHHFDEITSRGLSGETLKTPTTRLHELAGTQQVRWNKDEAIMTGPKHKAVVTARISFISDLTGESVSVEGGSSTSAKAARHRLAEELFPVLLALHSDLAVAKRISSDRLVEKLASFFLPAAFAAAPGPSVDNWRILGLLGCHHLLAGDYRRFSVWANQIRPYLVRAKIGISELERRALEFYSLIGNRRWDFRSLARDVMQSVTNFVKRDDALDSVASVKDELFFARLRQLLRVSNLMAKPKTNQSSLHNAVESISVLRSRNDGPVIFSGPDLTITERDGELVELLTELFDSLGDAQHEVIIAVSINQSTGCFSVNIRKANGPKRDVIDKYLKQSMIIEFLQVDGVIEAPIAEDCGVNFSGILSSAGLDFTRSARMAIESPFTGTTDEARSAMSKILHDLKNHLIAAQIAGTTPAVARTDVFRRQAEVSTHLDATDRLAKQFDLLSGVLAKPHVGQISIRDFFRAYSTRLLTRLPASVAVIPPKNVDDASVWTSAEFLESILDNLVQNSVEAMNTNGRITLSWRFSNKEEGLTFSLSDNGPGIEPEDLERILSGITLTSSKKGGTGVGMLTVVSMLRVLGGTISGASGPNEGATWTITVPSIAPIAAPPLPDYDTSVKVAVE